VTRGPGGLRLAKTWPTLRSMDRGCSIGPPNARKRGVTHHGDRNRRTPTPPEPNNPEEYDYEKCPFTATSPFEDQTREGTVVSTDMDKTVIVERENTTVPKYDRHMKTTSRIPAHVPGVLEPLGR